MKILIKNQNEGRIFPGLKAVNLIVA